MKLEAKLDVSTNMEAVNAAKENGSKPAIQWCHVLLGHDDLPPPSPKKICSSKQDYPFIGGACEDAME